MADMYPAIRLGGAYIKFERVASGSPHQDERQNFGRVAMLSSNSQRCLQFAEPRARSGALPDLEAAIDAVGLSLASPLIMYILVTLPRGDAVVHDVAAIRAKTHWGVRSPVIVVRATLIAPLVQAPALRSGGERNRRRITRCPPAPDRHGPVSGAARQDQSKPSGALLAEHRDSRCSVSVSGNTRPPASSGGVKRHSHTTGAP